MPPDDIEEFQETAGTRELRARLGLPQRVWREHVTVDPADLLEEHVVETTDMYGRVSRQLRTYVAGQRVLEQQPNIEGVRAEIDVDAELNKVRRQLDWIAGHASPAALEGRSWLFIYDQRSDVRVREFGRAKDRVALLQRACSLYAGLGRLLRKALRKDVEERAKEGERVLRL